MRVSCSGSQAKKTSKEEEVITASAAAGRPSKREEKSENVRAERWLETAPFILEMGLRGQVTQSR